MAWAKTRLSLAAAEQHLETFADGVYFVDLTPLSAPDNIVTAIIQATDCPPGEAAPEDLLLNFLSHKEMLLVIDNWEHVITGAPLVSRILNTAPNIQILATSRRRLEQPGESLFHLSGMNFPQWETPADALDYAAVKLFMSSAKRADPTFELTGDNLDYMARICRLVGGMPLGIVLAAAWLGMLTVEEIAAEIASGIDFLEADSGSIPARQRSIEVVFAYSWQLMSDAEQQVYMQLSVFKGGFTREAAQAITGATLRQLMSLVNKSLIRRDKDSGRYGIHELARQYAYSYLQKSETFTETQAAHSHYYLAYLGNRENDLQSKRQLEAVEEITIDFDNISAAWDYALAQYDTEGIEKSVETLSMFLWHRLRWGVDGHMFTRAQARFAPHHDETPLRAWRMILARNHINLDDPVASIKQVLTLAEQEKDTSEAGLYQYILGNVYQSIGNFQVAISYYEASLSYLEASGYSYSYTISLRNLIWCYRELKNYAMSDKYFYQYQQTVEATDNPIETLDYLWELSGHLFLDGKLEEVERILHEAMALSKSILSDNFFDGAKWELASIFEFGLRGNFQALLAKDKEQDWQETIDRQPSTGHKRFVQTYQTFAECFIAIDTQNYHKAPQQAEKAFEYAQDWNWHRIAWCAAAAACEQDDLMRVRELTHEMLLRATPRQEIPWLLMGLQFYAILLAYDENSPERATELLALASTHRGSLSGWLNWWDYIARLKQHLINEVGEDAYLEAWESGKRLDLETVVQELLDKFEDAE